MIGTLEKSEIYSSVGEFNRDFFPNLFLENLAKELTDGKFLVIPNKENPKQGIIKYRSESFLLNDKSLREQTVKRIENFYGEDKTKYNFSVYFNKDNNEVNIFISENILSCFEKFKPFF